LRAGLSSPPLDRHGYMRYDNLIRIELFLCASIVSPMIMIMISPGGEDKAKKPSSSTRVISHRRVIGLVIGDWQKTEHALFHPVRKKWATTPPRGNLTLSGL
jgi:hypothetical protein